MATRVIALVRPQDESEYYWGSIIPDIRYLAEMPRSQTHIDEQRIGMVKNPRAEKYLEAARQLQKNALLRNLLMAAVKNTHLDRIALAHIKDQEYIFYV